MKNVVVFGCPRSGTSLFLEMFETLGWRTYFEPGMDFVMQHVATDTRAADGNKRPDEWAIKNPVDHYYTPGLTCDLDALTARHPDALKIWIVRHPLDTITSLLPGLEKKWSHQPYPRNWATLMGEPVEVRAAELWKYCNGTGYDNLHPDAVVSYEALVSYPRSTVENLCQFTGRQVDSAVDTFVSRVSPVSGVNEAKHQEQWLRPHSEHIGRWEEGLTIAQWRRCRRILGDLPDRFHYDTEIW